MQYNFNITLDHRKFGEMFIVCGHLYAIDSCTETNSHIRYVVDLYNGKLLNVDLPFSNPFRKTTTVGYNPLTVVSIHWSHCQLVCLCLYVYVCICMYVCICEMCLTSIPILINVWNKVDLRRGWSSVMFTEIFCIVWCFQGRILKQAFCLKTNNGFGIGIKNNFLSLSLSLSLFLSHFAVPK